MKVELNCENDIMSEKWYAALRQGKSGTRQKQEDGTARVFKLKTEAVEMIPEYSEEEEMRDLDNAMSFAKVTTTADDQGYLTVESIRKLASTEQSDEDDSMFCTRTHALPLQLPAFNSLWSTKWRPLSLALTAATS
eukprot:m.25298 g.25298  ORF g.25298 m.25298 type:complete len:136 (-) comp8693_c0_seq4:634-1041(-)